MLALHFDLLPQDLRSIAVVELVRNIEQRDNHLSTGFVGTPYLNRVLSEMGHLDTAYALLKQTTWPSWLYSVTQGATTIWERWDGWTHEDVFIAGLIWVNINPTHYSIHPRTNGTIGIMVE